ncbi:riboflavin synthase [Persephonella sp.]|uniref:riboflavin synthase n=1 Tax=Persephonella sp. TaxID=2060922 RepID=UPI0025FFD397|nr:riboflavin synthase [Persephonella sp.]
MFTGLIEEVGSVSKIEKKSDGIMIQIKAEKILDDLKIGDSVALNGVCLTVVDIENGKVSFDVSQETAIRSNLPELKIGNLVNLERALRLSDRLGGHIVQGHVDTIGFIKRIIPKGQHTEFIFQFPEKFMDLIVEKGSIAIDGISLTINYINTNEISINIIPHTIQNTNLKERKIGDKINIEFDILGKYVKRMISKGEKDRLEDLLESF